MSHGERKRVKEKPPVQSGTFRRRTGPMSQSRLPADPAGPPAGTPTPAPDDCRSPSPPDEVPPAAEPPHELPVELPRLQTPKRGRRLRRPEPTPAAPLTAQQ